jgi:hypothetical protein
MAATTLAVTGCGGTGERRDRDVDGVQTVAVERVSFPARQRVGQQSSFEMIVRNAGQRTIRDLVVTLRGFSGRAAPDAPQRPRWLVDAAPGGGVTTIDDTYACGTLAPGERSTLRWRVTAVQAGTHELDYDVPDARLADGRRPRARLAVRVSGRPAFAHVDPRTGRVVRE